MDTIVYFVTSSIFFLTSFFMNKSDCERKNSRILSLSSSIVLSLIGVPRAVEYLLHSGIKEYSCNEDSYIDDFMNIFFMTYLFLDLTIGYAYYKSKISFFTGYFHHITFIITNCFIYSYNMNKCSSLMYIVEIPTIYLNLGHFLNDNISININNIVMFFSFILCRIIYVIMIFLGIIFQESKDKYVFLPSLYLMLLAHLYWLYEILIKKINLSKLSHT